MIDLNILRVHNTVECIFFLNLFLCTNVPVAITGHKVYEKALCVVKG